MKTMLHKSFNSAKCKTALKLAVSRIKLLKNKKEVQLRGLKRDVAQLLQSGQQQTAMIRVEHVIREEKTMAAFDLIDIYCELVVARLPMIETQKNCPIDLKEAIASIIFASPRCADIPELMDVRKHFTAKYGKDFVTAAIELRPECGVNRMLVEKLSAMAPNTNTKLKVLSAIANDHNIEWEPTLLKEKEPEPPEPTLHARYNEKTSIMHMEPLGYQTVSQLEKMSDILPQSHDTVRSESGPKDFDSTENANIKMPTPGASYMDTRLSGPASEATDLRRFSDRVEDFQIPARQSWNMGFKDARAAAQAAAESAERASMAARAAAELSSREHITNPAFPGHGSNDDERMQEGHALHMEQTHRKSDIEKSSDESSSLQGKQRDPCQQDKITVDSSEVSFEKEHNELKEEYKIGGKGDRVSSQADVAAATKDFAEPSSSYHQESEDESDMNPLYEESLEVRNPPSSSAPRSGVSMEEHDIFSNWKGPTYDENFGDPFKQDVYNWDLEDREKPSHSSSHYGVFDDEDTSHSGALYGEEHHLDFDPWKPKVGSLKVPSVFVEEETMHVEKEAETNANPGVVFDDSASEDDDPGISLEQEHKVSASSSSLSLPDRKWSSQFSLDWTGYPGNSGVQSPVSFEDVHEPEITNTPRRAPIDSRYTEPEPASFYDSDGPTSEEETDKSKISRKTDPQTISPDLRESAPALRKIHEWTTASDAQSLGSGSADLPVSGRPPSNILSKSSSNDVNQSLQSPLNEYQTPLRSSVDASQQSPEPMIESKYKIRSDEVSTNLSKGSLTGGLRNKGYKLPPYRVGPVTDSSTSHPGTSASLEASPQPASSASGFRKQSSKNKSADVDKSSMEYIGSDSDGIEVKLAHKDSGDTYVDKSSRLRAPAGYFDLGESSSEEDLPKKTVVTKGRLGPGISRRTRGSTTTSMELNPRASYESSSAAVPGRKPSPPGRHDTATLPLPQTSTARYGLGGTPQVLGRMEEVKSRPTPSSRKTLREEASVPSVKEKPRTDTTDTKSGVGAAEIPSVSTPSPAAPSREDSTKKATHVHPKLPDYDALAAHLQSLRTNRR